jgi:phage head maturation protease
MTAPPAEAPARTAAAYTRAYVDRAAAAEGQPGDPIPFIAATEGIKGDGIDLRMSGARLERYLANPVVGYNHSYWGRDGLPIGRGQDTRIDGEKLRIDVVFDQSDEFARRVESKYRNGFLNAVSIGFNVWAWEDGKGSYWLGGVAQEWELTELSAVPIPMDPSAVMDGGRSALRALLATADQVDVPVDVEDVADHGQLLVRVSDQLADDVDPFALGVAIARGIQRAQRARAAETPAAPEPVDQLVDEADPVDQVDDAPAPVADPIDPNAVRSLLAAFSPGGTEA